MANRIAKNESKPSQFTPFPRLPKELRLKIWEFAAQVPRIVEICQLPAKPSSSDGNNSDDDEVSLNPNPFYSPTAIPPILHASRESRAIALEHYTPSFPHSQYPPTIFYNSAQDILYFPPWCFQSSVYEFEARIPDPVKDTVRKVAIENLVWYSSWGEGMVNNQIQISEFRGLEEFYLVGREPDAFGCGCCHEWDGPETGVVEFQVNKEAEELEEVREVEGVNKNKEKDKPSFSNRVVRDVLAAFKGIREADETWHAPEVKLVRLKRDGVIV